MDPHLYVVMRIGMFSLRFVESIDGTSFRVRGGLGRLARLSHSSEAHEVDTHLDVGETSFRVRSGLERLARRNGFWRCFLL